ncbi:MAG: hypothetical protein SCALA702_21880 [Melioribacteraceae bacterium]|nr:MAG: hypothetical protein SCALA702_21880 [Melioribacteraceae bacterium]
MKRFESKKDKWLVFVIWLSAVIMLATAVKVAYDGGFFLNLFLQPLNAGTVYLCLSVLYQTYYIVDGENLILRSGPITKIIKITDIEAVKPTKDVLSSPALSIDRLKILYKQSKAGIMVSPKEKEMFIREIGFDPETYTKIG